MKFKKTFIIICLVVCLFAMASVCAIDANDTAITNEDTVEIELSQDNEIGHADDNLQTDEEELMTQANNEEPIIENDNATPQDKLGDNEGTYYDLIDEIYHGGDKNLTKSYYRYTHGDTIDIWDSGVINGNGAVIDMAGSNIRAFYVYASDVTIKNLTIKNANFDGEGGAIYFANYKPCTVENCTFINNTASKGGGAVCFYSRGNVENCTFIGNTAGNLGGAGVYIYSDGDVINCNFYDNNARYGAAVISDGVARNCNFVNNIASGDGSAITFRWSGTAENCNFTGNKAGGDGTVHFAYGASGNVKNCNFISNSAVSGGAVYFSINSELTNCNFTGNTASDCGGAVYFYGSSRATKCNFYNNKASSEGGAIWLKSGNVENCSFSHNKASNHGGAILMHSGNVTNCNFNENSATGHVIYGGAVFFFNSGSVENCNFTYNSINGDTSYGGAVAMPYGSVENCNFNHNSAGFLGGAFYIGNDGNVTNCNFNENSASVIGGAFYIDNYGNVTNCSFSHNKASSDGGAIVIYSGSVENCNFTDNQASRDGGAISMNFGSVENCNFIDNSATGSGSAVYFDSAGNVANCNFTGNTANNDGGAVFINGDGSVINCSFSHNKASSDGGAIAMNSGSVENCNFTDNQASSSYGGAVFFNGVGNVENCSFSGNNAYLGGAVCFHGSGRATKCNFTRNSATKHCGAMYGGSAVNCNFIGNSAREWAAAFCDGVSAVNCTFISNSAAHAAAISSSVFSAVNCTFIGNSARVAGGAVWLSDANIENCNFVNNYAYGDDNYGGAIILNSGNVTNCKFTNNSALVGGAILGFEWQKVFADTCIFKTDSDTTSYTHILPPKLNVDNFTTFYGSGEKLTFDLKTDSGIPVTDGNISISVYYKNNNSWVGNYSCLSCEEWTVDLPVGNYYAIFDTEYAGFKPINRTLTVADRTTFLALNKIINGNANDTITLDKNFTYNSAFDSAFTRGILINRSVTINGNGYTIDANEIAHIFDVTSENVVLKDITFKNANFNGNGGAIYFSSSGTVINCNFTDNSVTGHGGAMYGGSAVNCIFAGNSAGGWAGAFCDGSSAVNCTFTGNSAENAGAISGSGFSIVNCTFISNSANVDGGAVWLTSAIVENCNFYDNKAVTDGGAIMMDSGNVTNCSFVNNYAPKGGAILSVQWWTVVADTCIFKTDSDTTFNTHILPPKLNVDNFTTVYGSGEKLTFDLKTDNGIPVTDGNILISVYLKDTGSWVGNYTCLSGEGWVVDLPAEHYIATLNTEYGNFQPINITLTVNKINSTLTVDNMVFDYDGSGSTNALFTGASGITANVIDQPNANVSVIGNTITVSGLNAGTHTLSVTTITDANHNNMTKTAEITVNKINSTLTVGDIVFEYKGKGSGLLSFIGAIGVVASVVNQTTAVVNVKDDKITVSGLNIGTYTLSVTAIADANHNNVTKTAEITVNKAKTQFTAIAVTATYNINKNMVITLKDSNGNALKGVKVSVYIRGTKTYTTDKNGQVKINVANLVPKTYTAKISFAGNAGYKASTKSVKVTVKKSSTKLVASGKSFTVKATKKVTATLKDSKNRVIKNRYVTFKVAGKTYKVRTNSKGVATATVKITKKGSFKTTVSFAGDAYYNKAAIKTIKITVK